MYIQLCDRCGKKTNNKPAFALPVDKDTGSLMINGAWFGETITLCNSCLNDFKEFRYEHDRFNKNLITD